MCLYRETDMFPLLDISELPEVFFIFHYMALSIKPRGRVRDKHKYVSFFFFFFFVFFCFVGYLL